MNNDTIKAVAEAIRYQLEKSTVRGSKIDNVAQAAIEAMQIREMTVEEVEEYIYSETKRFTETSALLALAKLGTIRIVGDV